MKSFHPPALSAALAALALFAAAPQAEAQQRTVGSGLRLPPPAPPPIGEFHGFPGLIIVEREVPVIVERETPPPPVPLTPPAPPSGEAKEARKPYVIGMTYSSLPGGCMKMIEGGASYYWCSGEWYRQMGKQYRAVAKP